MKTPPATLDPQKAKRPAATGRKAQTLTAETKTSLNLFDGTKSTNFSKNANLLANVSSPPKTAPKAPLTQSPTTPAASRNSGQTGQLTGHKRQKQRTPLQAIRAFCLECVCGQKREVTLCPADHCPLYPYRFGVRPATARAAGKQVAA